nr:MFS transporter [Corynebacterium lactis]
MVVQGIPRTNALGKAGLSPRRIEGVILSIGLVVVVIGSTMPSGLYALYQQQWGLPSGKTVVVFACYALGVVAALLFGHLADSVGRKPIALASMFLSVLSTATFLLATLVDQKVAFLYGARTFSGLSVGLATGSFTALLQEKLGTRTGALASTVAVSGALAGGPLVSAVVAVWSSSPLQAPFWIYWAITCISIICVALVGEPGAVRGKAQILPRFGVSRKLIPVFVPAALAIGCAYGVNGMFQSVVPLAARHMAFDSQLKLAFLTALMLGCSAAVQISLGLRHKKVSYSLGLVVMAAGLCCVVIGLMTQSAAVLILATMVCGIGQGVSFKYSLMAVSQAAQGKSLSATVSSYYIVGYVGTALGPLVAGLAGGSSLVVSLTCGAFAAASVLVAGGNQIIRYRQRCAR